MGIPVLEAACTDRPVSIYVLIDTRTNVPFYIGATTRLLCNRLSSHVNDARISMAGDRCDAIRAILDSGQRPIIVVLEVVPHRSWVEAEQFWIGYLRMLGAVLTNIGVGGPGALGARQGTATRARRRQAAAGRDMSRLHLPEVRELAASKMRQQIAVDVWVFPGIKRAAVALGVPYARVRSWLRSGHAIRLTT